MCKMIDKCRYGGIGYFLDEGRSYKDFVSVDEASTWGERKYSAWAKEYIKIVDLSIAIMRPSSSTQYDPVRCYAGEVYRQINEFLRWGKPNDSVTRITAHTLLFSLVCAPRIPEDIVAYRLVCNEFVENELVAMNKRGEAYCCEKGFMSTTIWKGALRHIDNGHKNLLKIYVPKGTIGIYTEIFERAHRGEYELLLPPNRYLGLLRYPYEDEIDGVRYRVFECKLINGEG